MRIAILATLLALATISAEASPVKSNFGKTADGTPVEMYTLTNKAGLTVKLMTRGATIVEILMPDKTGKAENIVLGFDDIAGYESKANQHFGCITGRVCNRIAKGQFTIGDKSYQLAINDPPNTLHGGVKRSLDKVVWEADPAKPSKTASAVLFTYTSPDGEENFPGNLRISVTYILSEDSKLTLHYEATTDKATPVNLTNHCYFNLAGAGSPSVLDHMLHINADKYTPVDATLIPTGKIEPVEGTPLDFSTPTKIGARIDKLVNTPTKGYDHNFVIKGEVGKMKLAARLSEPKSGRVLTVSTTQPGIQFYSGNFLFGQKGAAGKTFALRSACALETQHFPDAVHHKNFPSIILEPGKTFRQTTEYAFSVEK